MEIIDHDSGGAFLERAAPQLLQAEAFSGLLYGIADRVDRLAASGDNAGTPLMATVEAAGRVRLAAVMTPPHRLLLHGADAGRDTAALEALADWLRERRWAPPGVLGSRPLAEAFAGLWRERTGQDADPDMALTIYQLRQVRDRGSAPGRLRSAGEADRELLEAWMDAFHREIHGRPPAGQERDTVARRLPEGAFRLWEHDGQPVSVAASTRPTPRGISINAVFTPARLRGRGYATACVAGYCQELLDDGREFCVLFADVANPVSNSIYRRIGFEPFGEFLELDFAEPAPD